MAAVEGASYWCYQCNRSVRSNLGGEVLCPVCSGGFLEEIENPSPTENIVPPFGLEAPFGQTVYFSDDSDVAGDGAAAMDAEGARSQPRVHTFTGFGSNLRDLPGGNPGIFQFVEAMSSFLQQVQPHPLSQPQPQPQPFSGGGSGSDRVADPSERAQTTNSGMFNPTLVMQGTIENFLRGGGNVEISFENGVGVGPRLLPENIGDYYFGPGLQQLIQQLAENDPNRYGAPPAAKSAIESLPTITISEEHIGTDYALCAVCKDEFDLGAEVRQMPCKHMYHADCIFPWLAQHNSCPVCRFELPTDDPEYNQIHVAPTSPSPPPQSVGGLDGGGEAGGDSGNEGFRIWGSGLIIGHPQTGAGTEQITQNANIRSVSAAPAGAVSQDDGSGGGGSRRRSFQLPWPFRFNNATASSPAVAHSEVSISGEGNQGERQSSYQSAGISPTPRISRTAGEDGDDTVTESQREDLD